MKTTHSISLALSIAAFLAASADKMPPLPDGAFTYAVIPDTQAYDGEGRTTKGGRQPGTGPTRNAQLDAIVDWLAKNAQKENIRFVTHTGDITDMNNEPQWTFAEKAMARLDGVVPYAVVPGNHDMKYNGDTSLFQTHFPATRYATNVWYAGTFGGFTDRAGLFTSCSNANSCCLFEFGKEKFVVMHLECNAPDPVLKWAGDMLEKYADRHAIVATHQDLGAIAATNARTILKAMAVKANRATYQPDLSTLGRMKWFKCHGKDGNSGLGIWQKLSSKHKNVFLVVSGDQGMVKITRVDERGEKGNMVYSLMQDTGAGYIRIFRFIPSERRIACYTIDPRHDGELVHSNWCWRDDAWFNFELPYPGCGDSGKQAGAEFKLVSPAPEAVVPLMPEPYRAYLSGDRAMRRQQMADPKWRKEIVGLPRAVRSHPLGVTFAWKGVEGGKLDVWRKTDGAVFATVTIPSNTYELTNFEIAQEYGWRVTAADGRIQKGAFRTEDFAPRLVTWPGIPNVRDLGGRKGFNGRRVRQGLVYRSAGLNYNAEWAYLHAKELNAARADGTLAQKLADTVSLSGRATDVTNALRKIEEVVRKSGEVPEDWCDRRYLIPTSVKPGKRRMTDETRDWICAVFGIRTDLDLRCYREVYGMKGSPLGPGVRFVNFSSSAYETMGYDSGRAAFANDFRVFLDRVNYPIVFHCIAGADRTGSLACILNGLLGVEEEELYRDWEVTCFVDSNLKFSHATRFDYLIEVFGKYDGATLNDRIEAYVLSCGFTKDDIGVFRAIMLE